MSGILTATLVGTAISSIASSRAQAGSTRAQVAASDRAAEQQMSQFEQSRADQMPWLEAGRGALETLQERVAAGPGEFKESPGYKFRLAEGSKNLMQYAAATGGSQSGATLKALQDYGQQTASSEYDNFLGRYYQSLAPLQSLAGVGQTTARGLGEQGAAVSSGVADIYRGQGAATARGIESQSNIRTGAIQGLANIGASYLGQQSYGGSGGGGGGYTFDRGGGDYRSVGSTAGLDFDYLQY